MAPMPASEENARKVLLIYQHYGTQPGGSLMTEKFLAVSANYGISEADLLDGVRYGGEQGWLEDGPNGSMQLTAAGFAEIQNA